MVAVEPLEKHGTEALEKCVTRLLIGGVLRVRDEKASEAEEKGKVRLWGVGGSSLRGDKELSMAFLKPVLSSSESWND